ncbi:hypothetical protein SAY86_026970 [Trapa natans]|uniref:non-specific serine/threonine protein kinase n=1 Tax=Trapa natans TaxID=22666 RepID=A0AAN7KS96_TRANT|nr:hypothetical protein SAY86_026970 [Trapa natans]
MSKVKHFLKKLHIGSSGGGGAAAIDDHHRLDVSGSHRPVTGPIPSLEPGPISVEPVQNTSQTPADLRSEEFSFLEEEFQVQLALALSASSADHVVAREDPNESAQIDAVKRISLGCPVKTAGGSALAEFLSLRYWSYNVVNYDEKVVDGFYDVHGAQSSPIGQGKMPSLQDLQSISVSANTDCEVVVVNRILDPELQQLEEKAMALSMEGQVSNVNGLVWKIADMVVNRMGGPVYDADEMVKRWTLRSRELQNVLNSIIYPLGQLDIGLSRHRALLFKVLADKIDLPCKLVKGSYYTGTDEGAVNLIRIENGSEYIIDLMGAPGTLIPAEVPSVYVSIPDLDMRGSTTGISSAILDGGTQTLVGETDLAIFPQFYGPKPRELPVEMNQTERFEHEFGMLLPSLRNSKEGRSSLSGKAASAQKLKVKNVSKYVISASKNPDFAQKLHAVLLESGASPPPDLFSNTELNESRMSENLLAGNMDDSQAQNLDKFSMGLEQISGSTGFLSMRNTAHIRNSASCPMDLAENLSKLATTCADSGYTSFPDATIDGCVCANNAFGELSKADPRIFGDDYERQIAHVTRPKMRDNDPCSIQERVDSTMQISCRAEDEKLNPVLGDAAEWDIKWEDLQLGERIGIGSYGEVYHAEWNGTEVAVKKFLDQDFSGDALVQFKCEIEIMLRLRHPNVVLFMGAVTRPPHFSILTEFLPRGSLYRLLHRQGTLLDEKRRMKMALDVAKGMNYLHTSHPTIVHRDLKSPNLLVDKNWVVKVCDFGLSRLKHHTFLSSKSTAGTPEWMAPEVLRNELANEKCDVYSFGVILWELATLYIPWKGLNPMQVVGAVGFQNRRLEIPEEVDPTVAQIICECWETEPHLRPSFTQLMYRLKHLQRLVVEPTNPRG